MSYDLRLYASPPECAFTFYFISFATNFVHIECCKVNINTFFRSTSTFVFHIIMMIFYFLDTPSSNFAWVTTAIGNFLSRPIDARFCVNETLFIRKDALQHFQQAAHHNAMGYSVLYCRCNVVSF